MHILHLHLEILDNKRKAIFDKLPTLTGQDYYLSGGTALALQIGHRISYDFDLFTQNPISSQLAKQVSQTVTIKTTSVDSEDEFTVFTEDNVKLTFLSYPYKPIYDLIELENGMNIAPITEIAIQKAYTIGRRGAYRDYFDLYTILNNGHITLDMIIQNAQKKYGSLFSSKLFLEQLVYFDDLLEFEIVPVGDSPIPEPEIVQNYFEEHVKKFLEQQINPNG